MVYLKYLVENIAGTKSPGKAITCKKLIEILKKLSPDYLLDCSDITRNIGVYDKEYNECIGAIDIGTEEYEEWEKIEEELKGVKK